MFRVPRVHSLGVYGPNDNSLGVYSHKLYGLAVNSPTPTKLDVKALGSILVICNKSLRPFGGFKLPFGMVWGCLRPKHMLRP